MKKITESDDIKQCSFSDSSPLKELIENCTPDNFVETSKQLAENLYDIMNSNIDIPAADIAILVFSCEGCDYLGFLKMNYKTSYTHATAKRKGGNRNDIILQARSAAGSGTEAVRGLHCEPLRRKHSP